MTKLKLKKYLFLILAKSRTGALSSLTLYSVKKRVVKVIAKPISKIVFK